MSGHAVPDTNLLAEIEATLRARQARRVGAEVQFVCPAHEDHHPSARWNPEKRVWHCDACGAGGGYQDLAERLGVGDPKPATRFNSPSRGEGGVGGAANRLQPCTLAAYAASKCLPIDFLRSLGVSDFQYMGAPAIRVPYPVEDGGEDAVRFRLALDKGASARFKWKTGSKVHLYGLNRLTEARRDGVITIVEGESDAQTLWFHHEAAVGVAGAGNWRDDRDAGHLQEIAIIYVIAEPDEGGEKLLRSLRDSRLRDQIRVIRLDGYKDVSDLYVADPATFRERWERAKADAEPLTTIVVREAQTRRLQLAAEAENLARTPDILSRLVAELRRAGVVGEDRAIRLLYLVATSRLLTRIASAVVKGPSSAGKSFVCEQVLNFFPDSAYYALTSMSERALAYSEEPVSHRMIVLYEAAGLNSDFASYLLRSLLSEGCIKYETVEKTAEGLKARLVYREGPAGALITTTSVKLHAENETRLISIPVADSPEQTAAILMAQATGGATVDYGPWHALQEWIAGGRCDVVIPYAADLARMIPPAAVRLRRDFPATLTLIRSHALLHQATREIDDQGGIVATLDDYGAVRALVADLIAEGADMAVSATVKDTVSAVARILGPERDEATVAEVARVLKLDKSAALRRVQTAVNIGYLRNLEDRRGRPARLQLGAPLPTDTDILPTVEGLQGCSTDRRDSPPPKRMKPGSDDVEWEDIRL